ncbi:MAG: extracellular solute-binding protein [Treponema sp.]|nr:extracellular solute-binding protein [Treponema sp.]
MSMRKVFLMLCLICSASLFAAPKNSKTIFEEKFGQETVGFYLTDQDGLYAAVFADSMKAEVNVLVYDESETEAIKKLAFESKVLVKSVTSREQYDERNIFQEIVKKFRAFTPIAKNDYDFFGDYGFVRVSYFITQDASISNRDRLGIQSTTEKILKLLLDSTPASSTPSSSKTLEENTKLNVWSFTDELETYLCESDYGYMDTHPNVLVEYSLTPTDQFPTALDSAFARGDGPDVFALEEAFVRRYVESGMLLPLDDLYEEVKDKMEDYPIKIGSYDGHVYAMSWSMSPGAMFYRRSLAKKYLGTDDPEEIQKLFSDPDKMLETARLLKKKSNGKCVLVTAHEDLYIPFLGMREKPWVVDGEFNIDPAMDKYMEICKIMYDEELDGRAGQWSEAWFAGMNDNLRDEKGNKMEVFSYFLPYWGLQWVLKPNAPYTSGDWAMCAGPSSWYWGGTWIAANKDTKNPEAAKEMIRYLTTNETFLEEIAKSSGEVVCNIDVQDKIKYYFAEPYIGGQNYYKAFCEYAKTVDGSLSQFTDQYMDSGFSGAVTEYRYEGDKQEALEEMEDWLYYSMGL